MTVDVTELKQAAQGRWLEILQAVGIPSDSLDGRHHPCPRCGGTDRFRLLDASAGACYCNQCFNKKNGDGLAAVAWLLNDSFPKSLDFIAEHLGLTNGQSTKPKTFSSARGALDAYDLGTPTMTHQYYDANGEAVGLVARFDTATGKTYRPVALVNGGWSCGAMPSLRPLYRLTNILGAESVHVFEGEKCVDAAESIGLVATTGAGGANAVKHSDWSVLAGKRVCVWPDNDKPGLAWRDNLVAILSGHNCDVIPMPPMPGVGPKGDLVDWIENQGEAAEPETLRERIEGMQPATENATENATDDWEALTVPELVKRYPKMRPPVVDGLGREGETMNVIAASKIGKSWSMYALAYAVATGSEWFGFPCEQGNVLILDNELHPETVAWRVKEVANELKIPDADQLRVSVICLRAKGLHFGNLKGIVDTFEHEDIKLLVTDSYYRALPPDKSENNNDDTKDIYNLIDQYNEQLGALWANVHHSTKGDQGDKRVTDVGSGAGAMSRAADTHVVIREHEDPEVFVLEAALRSFAPVEPIGMRWRFPLWIPDDEIDTRRIKTSKTRDNARKQQEDEQNTGKIIAALAGRKELTRRKLIGATGLSKDRLERLLGMMGDRIIEGETKVNNATAATFKLAPCEVEDG